MARSIAPSTPAFSNYGDGIHPIVKGGFGSNSLSTIKANIDALDRTNTNAQGGVVPIGDNGIANLAPYGISIITDTISGWSNVANIARGTMVDDIPKNEEAKLVNSDPADSDKFGYSISISNDGSRVAVGTYSKLGTAVAGQGAAYIFS